MSDDNLTPQDEAVIERLRNAPQKTLSPRISQAIHAKVLSEFQNPAPMPTGTGAEGVSGTFSSLHIAFSAAALILVVIVGVWIGAPPSHEATITVIETATPAETPTITATVTPTATATATPTLTLTVTPEPTETVELETILVLEGIIQSVGENSISVHDIQINVSAEMVAIIRVGDVVRIEGITDIEGGQIVINATAINRIIPPTSVPGTTTGGGGATGGSGDGINCNNPPPPWAPAQGWRARCEGTSPPGRGRP